MHAEIHLGGAQAGLRRSTAARRRASAMADAFEGLPDGVTRWRLAAALRAAARPLDLTAPMLALIEHYIDLSWDADWTPGAEPVIIHPLTEIAEAMGRSERQIRNIEAALAERGLLAWRDSGNHHRKGRRRKGDGRLIYAFGPSLAPLAARAEEIIALAAAARETAARRRRLRLAISALRRGIGADLAACPPCPATLRLQGRLAAAPERLPAGIAEADLQRVRDDLAALAGEVLALLTEAEDGEGISGKAETGRRHVPDTPPERSMNGSCSQRTRPEGRDDISRVRPDGRKCRETSKAADPREAAGLAHVPLGLALEAAGPRVQLMLPPSGPLTWAALVEAAHGCLADLGLNPALWREACGILGRNGAALCVIAIERGLDRPDGAAAEPIANPGGYFRAMIARARSGELRLHRTIFALAGREEER